MSTTDAKLLVARHLAWMATVNFAPTSVATRQRYLTLFVAWCQARDVTELALVTPALVERYQRHLFNYRNPTSGQGLSFRSQRYHLSHLREFLRWCVRSRQLATNPAADLELPKVGRSLPKHVLTIAEVEQVLSAVDLEQPAGVRDRAILETFYSTGIRRRELASLMVGDVDAGRGTVTVRQGKGGKDRVVPIGERALTWLAKYTDDVRPALVHGSDPGNLFLSRDGQPLNIATLSRLVREHVDRAAVGKRGSCHLFRHTMATLMLEGGADVRHVQEMLGHEHLTSTQIYTHVAIAQLKEAHAACHPGAKLKPGKAGRADDEAS